MRNILFRGKNYYSGEWYYGDLLHTRYKGEELPATEIATTEVIARAYPETVGQYTGLTDKNGTKIFEGDIIKYVFPCENAIPDIGIVKFDECALNVNDIFICGFYVEWINDHYLRKDLTYWACCKENKIDVIGNIYDNPELLTNT